MLQTLHYLIHHNEANVINVYHAETYEVFNWHFAILLKDCTLDMFLPAYLLDPSKW
jgi:hypothetical protein